MARSEQPDQVDHGRGNKSKQTNCTSRAVSGQDVESTSSVKSRKRSFNEAGPELLDSSNPHDDALPYKRRKSDAWPLNDGNEQALLDLQLGQPPKSLARIKKRPSKKPLRPSKFIEGSLNDKPSKQPPASFLGENRGMDEWGEMHVMKSIEHDTGSEREQSVGIFRFGKAVASALNPLTYFHGLNDKRRSRDTASDVHESVSAARKEEVERAYEYLKAGPLYKGNALSSTAIHKIDLSKRQATKRPHHGDQSSSSDDGRIDVKSSKIPTNGNPAEGGSAMRRGPSLTVQSTRVSPKKKLSIPDLKKVKSQMRLSSRRRVASAKQLPSIDSVVFGSSRPSTAGGDHRAAKRELAQYHKLSNKVSDLETRLRLAREELDKTFRSAPPVPSISVSAATSPGITPRGLETLPSERLLAQRAADLNVSMPAFPAEVRNVEVENCLDSATLGDLLEIKNVPKEEEKDKSASPNDPSPEKRAHLLLPSSKSRKPATKTKCNVRVFSNEHPGKARPRLLTKPAASPRRSRDNARKLGISPPPPSRSGKENTAPKRVVSIDKPLPDIQREDYVWDEDVF